MATVLVRIPIEVDITYVNKTWFSLKKKSSNAKHYVIGIFQRGVANVPGKAIIRVLQDNTPEAITESILLLAEKGCMLYAEENILPTAIKELYTVSELKTSEGERVSGEVHVNNVKNMWKDLKRQLKRTHVWVSKKHLQLYCDEVAWRISHKHLSPIEKFDLLITMSAQSDHTTYKKLIE